MENRTKKPSINILPRSQSSQRLKFKELPIPNSDFNELNSKYELYRQGSPNIYNQDLQTLKARNIKGEVGMVELPAIDYIIAQMCQTDKEKTINHRNYDLYPSLLKNSQGRYKQMLSEKQEVKDFIVWFQTQYQNIQKNQETATKKFHDKQTLIAAGFTEMTSQVAKISKHRAEILKMLWNREHGEVTAVIESLNSQAIKKEKTLLEQISAIHREYQDQIEILRKTSKDLQEKYGQEKVFSRACVNDLRILRKRIKKLQYVSRKLGESNGAVRKENLHLMEQNIKLLSTIKDITQEQSVVLNYRKLQLHNQKQNVKKHNYKELLALTQPDPEESLTPLHDLEEKKNNLFEFFLERVKENPDEKTLIKDEYFTDEDDNRNAIEHYFKNVINRPNVQIQLLNEQTSSQETRERGVNTDKEEQSAQKLVLSLDKGVQAEVRSRNQQNNYGWQCEGERVQGRVYHIMDMKEQESQEQESKMRIIQHRISRKNSLTLLQLQNMSDFNKGLVQKKSPLSNFAKKPITLVNLNCIPSQSDIEEDAKEDNIDDSKSSVFNKDDSSQSSSQADKQETFLNGLAKNIDLTAISMRTSVPVRKSINFKEILKNVSDGCQSVPQEGVQIQKSVFISLNGEQQEAIKQSQLQDLISKHLQKNTSSVMQSPEKNLGKFFLSLFRSLWGKSNINMKFQLLDMIKQSYGNVKSVMWKFLNVVSMIKQSQNANPLLKAISVMLKINDKYEMYDAINTSQLADLYFHLFAQLTIKNIHDEGFNIWKACTSLDKIRTIDFMSVVQEFFSQKKRRYIEGKITELLAASQQELRSKKVTSYSSRKRIELVSEDHSIMKLNPLILYIMEVYLIEKQLYHASYVQMADFISVHGVIPVEVFLWLIELLGFNEEKQINIIEFVLPTPKETPKEPSLSRFSQQNKKASRTIKTDMFFRCCVKFDFPIMEELSVATYSQFKSLPVSIQQKYYRMIGMQEWMEIKDILLDRYQSISESPIYLSAFTLITDKLQNEIRKGASIYGQQKEQKIKRQEEVFSLFYKILIIEAHRNLLNQEEGRDSLDPATRH